MNKLLLNLILYQSKPKNDQGFSLFEVCIAILVSSAFLMGTLQAMTINAVLQIRAERQAQANFLIQQDVERIQALASSMDLEYVETSPVLNSGGSSQSQLCWRYDFANPTNTQDIRFGADFVKELDNLLKNDGINSTKSDPAINTNSVFSTSGTFKQFDTDENGNVVFTNGEPILNTSSDTSGDNKKVVVQIVNDTEIINKDYRVVRVMTVDSSTKYDVLQVYYRVGEPYDNTDPNQTDEDKDTLRDNKPGRTSIIAENYTEVIPSAVAECGLSPST